MKYNKLVNEVLRHACIIKNVIFVIYVISYLVYYWTTKFNQLYFTNNLRPVISNKKTKIKNALTAKQEYLKHYQGEFQYT